MADACDVTDIALEAAMERAALEVAKKAAIIPLPSMSVESAAILPMVPGGAQSHVAIHGVSG